MQAARRQQHGRTMPRLLSSAPVGRDRRDYATEALQAVKEWRGVIKGTDFR